MSGEVFVEYQFYWNMLCPPWLSCVYVYIRFLRWGRLNNLFNCFSSFFCCFHGAKNKQIVMLFFIYLSTSVGEPAIIDIFNNIFLHRRTSTLEMVSIQGLLYREFLHHLYYWDILQKYRNIVKFFSFLEHIIEKSEIIVMLISIIWTVDLNNLMTSCCNNSLE